MDEDNSSDAIVLDDAVSQDTHDSNPEETGDWGVEETESTDKPTDESKEESNDESDEPDEPETAEESDGEEETEEQSEESDEPDETEEAEETPQERARREYQERQAARQQAAQEQELRRQEEARQYVEQAEDEKDAAIRQLQVENYLNKVQAVEQSIVHDYESATKDIDIFNPESTNFNQQALNVALEEYNRGYVQTDESGNVVAVAQPLKQYLQAKADLYKSFMQSGATQGQQAERKMRAKSTPVPTRSPKQTKTDAFEEGFLSEF